VRSRAHAERTAWLLGESLCSADALAAALRRVTIAAVNAMTP